MSDPEGNKPAPGTFALLIEDTRGLSAGVELRDELLASIAISLKRLADATPGAIEQSLAEVDGFLILGWSIDDALNEHPYDNIGAIAKKVQARHAARSKT